MTLTGITAFVILHERDEENLAVVAERVIIAETQFDVSVFVNVIEVEGADYVSVAFLCFCESGYRFLRLRIVQREVGFRIDDLRTCDHVGGDRHDEHDDGGYEDQYNAFQMLFHGLPP